MYIKSFGSSSKGNCYLISDGFSSLLLEAGLSFDKVKKDVKLHKLSGCFVTHEHKDHSKYVSSLLYHCVKVYMTQGTKEASKLEDNYNLITCKYRQTVISGTFKVTFFETQHDAKEPAGFLIESLKTGERLLFATDTYYIKYKFKNLDYIMIECNYDLDILNRNIESGKISSSRKNRILKSHFSLQNVVKYLKCLDLKKCKKIYLMHLSDDNSDELHFQETIMKIFFIETVVFDR